MSKFRSLATLLVLLASACVGQPSKPMPIADMPNVDSAAALADIKKLASDEFEGRAPGSKGEQLTVQYLTDQFKAIGLEPGNPDGTWTQKVPLVSLTPESEGPLVVKKGGQTKSFKVKDE